MPTSRKGPPNASIDFFNGPNAPMPGVRYLSNQPGRIVKTNDFKELYSPGLNALWYITFTGQRPSPPLYAVGGGIVSYDYRWADRLALVTGGPATHYVWRIELFKPSITPNYGRVWIAPLPAP